MNPTRVDMTQRFQRRHLTVGETRLQSVQRRTGAGSMKTSVNSKVWLKD